MLKMLRFVSIFFVILLTFVTTAKPYKIFIPQKSSLVVEYSNGKSKVLHQNCAEAKRHPASLTKIMTIYLLLEAIENKKISINTKFKVSKFASNQMPSKLGLIPGETISALDCIKALLVKSANDVAVVVAEGVSGSVSAFCSKMNSKAKALGMSSTHFENPSGVPNIKQITSASDIVILGLSLYKKFQKYWPLFSLKNFTYKGKQYGTHCKILRWYKGSDGAKTGFTCASGYNLWVTAEKKNSSGKSKRLFAVVFGEPSGKYRDFYAAKLFDNYFKDYNIIKDRKTSKSKGKSKITTTFNTTQTNKSVSIVKNIAPSKPVVRKSNINKNKVVKNNNIQEKNEEIIYELDSIPISDIIKSSGKSEEYFDELYSDDKDINEIIQAESAVAINFSQPVKKLNRRKINNKVVKKNKQHNTIKQKSIAIAKSNNKTTVQHKKNLCMTTNKIVKKTSKINY